MRIKFENILGLSPRRAIRPGMPAPRIMRKLGALGAERGERRPLSKGPGLDPAHATGGGIGRRCIEYGAAGGIRRSAVGAETVAGKVARRAGMAGGPRSRVPRILGAPKAGCL